MTTLRLTFFSIILCCFAYTSAIYGFARIADPDKASGSLIKSADGTIIGSHQIGQEFTTDRYFRPRPSACSYNGISSAGSNLSPTNGKLTTRANEIIALNNASSDNPIPADLVTASGSGLDPDISEDAARFQASRVAGARKMDAATLAKIIDQTKRPLMGQFGGPFLVNVLELNLALDAAAR